MAELKRTLGVHDAGSRHWVGDGFHVRNMFPSNGVENDINPFLMLDYAGPTEVQPGLQPKGVGEHPHRGFETVTIAYQGAVEHRDSAGHSGTIRSGDVQWMTAASGVVHEEMHEREFAKKGGIFEMVQLWVNLPREHKMSQPQYQTLLRERIPVVNLGDGATARVIAGELNGAQGPARTFTPVNVFDVRLKSGSFAEINLPEGHRAGLVLMRGAIQVNSREDVQGEAKLVVLSEDGESVRLYARQDSTILVLSGEPIDEPVASYGPFVMNTREEIVQAVRDYNAGKMGRLH